MKTFLNVMWAIIYENTKDALMLVAAIAALAVAFYLFQFIGRFMGHPGIAW